MFDDFRVDFGVILETISQCFSVLESFGIVVALLRYCSGFTVILLWDCSHITVGLL